MEVEEERSKCGGGRNRVQCILPSFFFFGGCSASTFSKLLGPRHCEDLVHPCACI